MTKEILKERKKIYENGENIIQYLKRCHKTQNNTNEIVKISYDFQSGSYIRNVLDNPEYNEKYTGAISKVINELGIDFNFILEAGVGEATTLANVIPKLKHKPKKIYGFDIAWSRVRHAVKYMKEGKFGEGNMSPKIEAALRFVEKGGAKSVITEATKLEDKTFGTKITLE